MMMRERGLPEWGTAFELRSAPAGMGNAELRKRRQLFHPGRVRVSGSRTHEALACFMQPEDVVQNGGTRWPDSATRRSIREIIRRRMMIRRANRLSSQLAVREKEAIATAAHPLPWRVPVRVRCSDPGG